VPFPLNAPPWRTQPPGLYELEPQQADRLPEVRMDVVALVGLTERGPLYEATIVESWSSFLRLFGRVGGGRMLPDVARLFFANGGRRCVVVRCLDLEEAQSAELEIEPLMTPGATHARLRTRSAGGWGNKLSVSLQLRRTPLVAGLEGSPNGELVAHEPLSPGTRLRFTWTHSGLLEAKVHNVTSATETNAGWVHTLEPALDLALRSQHSLTDDAAGRARLAAGEVISVDLALAVLGAEESHADAALHPDHPRFLGRLLDQDSHLATLVDQTSLGLEIDFDQIAPRWHATAASLVVAGIEPTQTTGREHFFLAADGREPMRLLDVYDDRHQTDPVSLVALPDLIHARDNDAAELQLLADDVVVVDLRFTPCAHGSTNGAPLTDARTARWPRLLVDGPDPIENYQRSLLQDCERHGLRIALLDLPPGMTGGDLRRWQQLHRSARAAAYGPYLRSPAGGRSGAPLLSVPPCGVAAGLIAASEASRGVHGAPANLSTTGLAGIRRDGALDDPALLHELRINAFRPMLHDVRLMGARTLSDDEAWTHLGIRRLVDYLRRQLTIDGRWAVFEPNQPRLWEQIRMRLERRLRRLLNDGAFAARRADDAFFVRCDATTNPLSARDAGTVQALVGIAPAIPAEFIVFQLVLADDGTVATTEVVDA
jgi:Bacteriophage tail sheath protein